MRPAHQRRSGWKVAANLCAVALVLGGCAATSPTAPADTTLTAQSNTQANPSSMAPTKAPVTDIHLQEVAAGDFSSLQGSWTGSGAVEITVTDQTMTMTASADVAGEPGVMSIKDTMLTLQKGPGATQSLRGRWNDSEATYGWISWSSAEGHGWLLAFYPQGVDFQVPEGFGPTPPTSTDVNVPRILAVPYLATARQWPAAIDNFILTKPNAGTKQPPAKAMSKAASAKPQDALKPPVAGAYPGAGGRRPAIATPIMTVSDPAEAYGMRVATAVMPSGNIGCEIRSEQLTCRVEDWPRDINPEWKQPDGWVGVTLEKTGPAKFVLRNDVPSYTGGNPGIPPGQVMPYGTVWFYERYVLASMESGLTIWNSESGYGALVNRDGMFPFGGK